MYEYEMFRYIDLQAVSSLISSSVRELGTEKVDVRRAVGRRLAEDIVMDRDVPCNDISHVDGFAVRVEDVRSVPVRLEVRSRGPVEKNTAVFVRTGEPVPEGTDAVVPIESVRVIDGFVELRYIPRRNSEIIPRGIDFRAGTRVFGRGWMVRPQDARLLLDLGIERVKVYRKPRLLIIPTGNEFVEGVRRESSSVFIAGVAEAYGGVCWVHDPLPDDPSAIARVLRDGLREYDSIALIGGSSIGERDYSWRAVRSLGINGSFFRGIKVQPGRVTSYAVVDGKPITLLPGFIESTFVALVYVLLPVIMRLGGALDIRAHRPCCIARLDGDVELGGKYKGFYRIRFAELWYEGDKEVKAVVSNTHSFMISPMLRAHGFIEIPPGETRLSSGQKTIVYQVKNVF